VMIPGITASKWIIRLRAFPCFHVNNGVGLPKL
jgi:hypothetical protein